MAKNTEDILKSFITEKVSKIAVSDVIDILNKNDFDLLKLAEILGEYLTSTDYSNVEKSLCILIEYLKM